MRTRRGIAGPLVAAAIFILLIAGAGEALAQATLLRPDPNAAQAPTPTGFAAWVAAQQSAFYKLLIDALVAFRESPMAGVWLVAASFLYGILHAAGPGHGKAVLGSYMLASRAAARRGALLALVSSLVQGVTALIAVGVLAVALNATGARISESVWTLERISFAILTLFGLWMLWRKVVQPIIAPANHANDHAHDHVHGADCGHAHLPEAQAMEGRIPFGQAASLVASIGMRPCSGAIIVLIFALSQNMVWTGALSVFAISLGTAITVSAIVLGAVGGRTLVMRLAAGDQGRAETVQRAIEGLGAFLIFGFGLVLLIGSFGPRPALF